MCGIAGIVYRDRQRRRVAPQCLKRMADAIAHRGPDAEGFYISDDGVGLAHRRLAIIDLETGDQPLGNEDQSIQIVLNGEIYNYQVLREQLLATGHDFRTRSDTETIVHLFEEQGIKAVDQLRGMFAFAIWDGQQQSLLLARDRFGQKPLYYMFDDEKLLFGSELKAILAYGGIPREIDPRALEDYLAFGFVPGGRTIFAGIHKLPPASTLQLDATSWNCRVQRYWHLDTGVDHTRTEAEWQTAVCDGLIESVTAHRIADVPIGAFLSGGLDSSVVTAVVSQIDTRQLATFSIGFQEKEYSELAYAKMVAEQFQTNHLEAIVTADAVASLNALLTFYDEPFADASAIPSMRLAQLSSEHVKVVLSGDGGDEAFGGYSRYAHDLKEAALRRWLPVWFRKWCLAPLARIWPKADWLPRVLRAKTLFTNLSLEPAAAYANTLCICRRPLRRQLLSQRVVEQLGDHQPEQQVVEAFGDHADDPLRGMLAADIAMMLPDDFLTKVDRASMAYGLEVRPPMVDHHLMELAFSIPSEFKIRDGQTKWLLKEVSQRWLTDEIVYRSKQGFEIPIDAWLRGPLRAVFEQTILSPSAKISDYLEIDVVRQLYDSHCKRVGRHGNLLWSILVLGAWMERYLVPDVELHAHIRPETTSTF